MTKERLTPTEERVDDVDAEVRSPCAEGQVSRDQVLVWNGMVAPVRARDCDSNSERIVGRNISPAP